MRTYSYCITLRVLSKWQKKRAKLTSKPCGMPERFGFTILVGINRHIETHKVIKSLLSRICLFFDMFPQREARYRQLMKAAAVARKKNEEAERKRRIAREWEVIMREPVSGGV